MLVSFTYQYVCQSMYFYQHISLLDFGHEGSDSPELFDYPHTSALVVSSNSAIF